MKTNKEEIIMKTAIIYESKHHGNTKKVCEGIVRECKVKLIEAQNVTENFEWDDYDLIGFASGIAYKKFYEPVNKAAEMLPPGKKVFFIYTCAKNDKDFSNDIKNIVIRNGCECLGSYGCKGFNTYGPLKLIGGMNKSNPSENEINEAIKFVKEIEAHYGN